DWSRARLIAIVVSWKDQRRGIAHRMFLTDIEPVSQRVRVAQGRGKVGLQRVGPIAARDRSGDAVEDEIANGIRRVVDARIAPADGNLKVPGPPISLEGQPAESRELPLALGPNLPN